MNLDDVKKYLTTYDGPEMQIMEVCGSHTAAIAKNGIPSMLSPKIRLISGPGCPVCVTPTAYVDRAIELAETPDTCLVTFGDLIRVPGSRTSLSAAKGEGAHVEMVYSPLDTLHLAEKNPDTSFVFAAVGFETTAPAYALLMQQITERKLTNVRLLTAMKTMPPVIDALCRGGAPVQGFLAPGHVSVITGSRAFVPLAERYSIPFGVAGFTGEEILAAVYGIVRSYGRGRVMNFYPRVVTESGNVRAQELIWKYFEPCSAAWRGLGEIDGSGLVLRPEYASFDAGSRGLNDDSGANRACRCGDVLTGRIRPTDCPLFGKICTPMNPKGACMVSQEGSCFTWLSNGRRE